MGLQGPRGASLVHGLSQTNVRGFSNSSFWSFIENHGSHEGYNPIMRIREAEPYDADRATILGILLR